MLVYVEGSLEKNEWTDKDGIKQFSVNIVLRNYNAALKLLDKSRLAKQESAFVEENASNEPALGEVSNLLDDIPFA